MSRKGYDHKKIVTEMLKSGTRSFDLEDMRELVGMAKDSTDLAVGYHVRKIKNILVEQGHTFDYDTDIKRYVLLKGDTPSEEADEPEPAKEVLPSGNQEEVEEEASIQETPVRINVEEVPEEAGLENQGPLDILLDAVRDPAKLVKLNRFLKRQEIGVEIQIKEVSLEKKEWPVEYDGTEEICSRTTE